MGGEAVYCRLVHGWGDGGVDVHRLVIVECLNRSCTTLGCSPSSSSNVAWVVTQFLNRHAGQRLVSIQKNKAQSVGDSSFECRWAIWWARVATSSRASGGFRISMWSVNCMSWRTASSWS